MREQIRLWFYSQLFMSVALTGKAPYRKVLGYEKLNDETGRPMHKSWGNAIWFDDAIEQMGADVMRWLFAAQSPAQNMSFGYGPADRSSRRLLTLWNSVPLPRRSTPAPRAAKPTWRAVTAGPASRTRSTAGSWPASRSWRATPARRSTRYATPGVRPGLRAFFDDLSNWYVRGSRRRFWAGRGRRRSRRCTTRSCGSPACSRRRCRSWPRSCGRTWCVDRCGEDAPASVHLAGFPEAATSLLDAALLAAMADARAVVELGHEARAEVEARLRQPLASAVVVAADPARPAGARGPGRRDRAPS